MRWTVESHVPYNSFDYLEKTLITANGFREYDVRWRIGQKTNPNSEINPNGFLVLGKAYGTYLQDLYSEQRVVVGHDFREYSQDLSRSFIVGLLSTGIHVIDIGLAVTPMVYFGQHHFGTKGGAIVTASHNENGWTGLKLAKGLSSTLEPDDILQFKELVMGGNFRRGNGTYESFDGLFIAYTADLLKGGPLERAVKVVLATGNGTAGRFGPEALKQLGCDVVKLDCEGDWNFPRHNPNPEDLSFLHSISELTVSSGAELGIGIDGDGDRIGIVDSNGREVFSDKIGLLLAQWLSAEQPGRPVVVDVKSTGLFNDDESLKKSRSPVITWKTGHSYIKAKVKESNAFAGFEKSGHWFFNEPFGRGYDDALLSAVFVLRFLVHRKQSLASLVDALPRTWQSPTIGAFCSDDVKYSVVDEITRQYQTAQSEHLSIAGKKIKELITVNGVRFVLDDDSWGLVRASSNKPSLVVVAEARTSEDQLYDIIEDIQTRLAKTGKIGEYDQQLAPRPALG